MAKISARQAYMCCVWTSVKCLGQQKKVMEYFSMTVHGLRLMGLTIWHGDQKDNPKAKWLVEGALI